MAFDLRISGFKQDRNGERISNKFRTLLGRVGGESWSTQPDMLTVGMGRLPEKKMARTYAKMVTLAQEASLDIYDLQSGKNVNLAAPGRLPPGWLAPAPVDPVHLNNRIKKFVRGHKGLGYTRTQWGVQRLVDDGRLLQRLTFTQKEDLYDVVVDWRFVFEGVEDPSWPAPIPIRDYFAGTPLESEWPAALSAPRCGALSAAKSDIGRSFAMTERAIDEYVQPLLDSVSSIESMVAGFESGRLGTVLRQSLEPGRPYREAFYVAFGYAGVGGIRNMALSYRHLGRSADGKARYQTCIEELGDPMSLVDGADRKKLRDALALFDG